MSIVIPMIHEIAPHRYNNSYGDRRPPLPSDAALYYEGNRILLSAEGSSWRLPLLGELPASCMEKAEYLFQIDEQGYYLLDTLPEKEGLQLHSIQICRTELPGCTAFAGVTGWQFYRFRQEHRFCGRCAAPLLPHPVDRAYICPDCGMVCYPKFSPAILVLVTDGDRCLMVRSKEYQNHLSPIAGFVEVGETFEQTVAREVMEEAGVRVKDIRYIQNQPWSFGDTIMVGFTARLDGEDTLKIQENEILEAGWYKREEMPEDHSLDSLGGQLLKMFKEGLL